MKVNPLALYSLKKQRTKKKKKVTYTKALGLLLFKWNFVFGERVFMGMAVSDWGRVSLLTFSDVLRFKWQRYHHYFQEHL